MNFASLPALGADLDGGTFAEAVLAALLVVCLVALVVGILQLLTDDNFNWRD